MSTASMAIRMRFAMFAGSGHAWRPHFHSTISVQNRFSARVFPTVSPTVVISSAVLHFARDDAEFDAMLSGCWRVLASRGMFFCRLASVIGFESRVQRVGENAVDAPAGWAGRGRYRVPDGTIRYLVDESFLVQRTRELSGQLLDPIKTTVVQDQRAMTTWVVRKS